MTRSTTKVSTKGKVILPKTIRDKRHWGAGTRLIVEEPPEGVLLKAEQTFPVSRPEDVFGSLRHDGPPISIEQMDEAVAVEIKRRHARGRY